MNKATTRLIFIFVLLSFTSLFGIRASHNQITISDKTDNQLSITIDDSNSDINRISLYYKSESEMIYRSSDLLIESSPITSFTFLIQSEINEIKRVKGNLFEYYILIQNNDGEITYLPNINPELNPYKSPLQQTVAEDAFVLISPEDLSDLVEGQYIIISMFSIKDQVNTDKIKIKLNGKTIKSGYKIDDALLIIQAPKSSTDNKLSITAPLKNGQLMESPTWDFRKVKKRSNFEYYGNLTLTANNNSYLDRPDSLGLKSNDEQAAIFQFSGIYKSYVIKNYLMITSLENKQNQKINKYYLGFLSPNFDLHLGDYSPNYSEFSVYNSSVEGVTTSYKAEQFKISLTAGRLERAVKPGNRENNYAYRAFNREHLSTKITFGNPNNYALSINMSKSKDNINSLDNHFYETVQDSTTHYLIDAKDNLVIGTDFVWNLFSKKLTIFGEVAVSVYNSNTIPGVMTQEELEDYIDSTLPFDPESLEALIIVNKNMEPFDFGLNNMAIKTGFNLNAFYNNITASFIHTGPSFYSLSSANIIQDKRILRIIDNVIISNKFFISGGAELSFDNTVNHKDHTLSTQSIFLNMNYSPNNLPFFSFNIIDNTNHDDRNSSDQLKIDINNRYMQFVTGYSYKFIPFVYTTSTISYGMGFDQDKSKNKIFDNDKYDISFNNTFRFNEFPLVSKFGLSTNVTKDNLNNKPEYDFYSLFLNNEYSFFSNKVIPFLNLKTNINRGDQNDAQNYILSTGTKYYPIKNTWLSADITYKTYSEKNANKDYNLIIGRLLLSVSF